MFKLLPFVVLAFFAIELSYIGISYLCYINTLPMTDIEAMKQLSEDM